GLARLAIAMTAAHVQMRPRLIRFIDTSSSLGNAMPFEAGYPLYRAALAPARPQAQTTPRLNCQAHGGSTSRTGPGICSGRFARRWLAVDHDVPAAEHARAGHRAGRQRVGVVVVDLERVELAVLAVVLDGDPEVAGDVVLVAAGAGEGGG